MPQIKQSFNELTDEFLEIYKGFIYWAYLRSNAYDKWLKIVKNNVALYLDATLLRDVILGVSRLCDPPLSSGKKNRSIAYFVNELNNPTLTAMHSDFLSKHDDFIKLVRNCRNKVISHSDLAKNFENKIKPDIEAFFEDGANLLNNISTTAGFNTLSIALKAYRNLAETIANDFINLFK